MGGVGVVCILLPTTSMGIDKLFTNFSVCVGGAFYMIEAEGMVTYKVISFYKAIIYLYFGIMLG